MEAVTGGAVATWEPPREFEEYRLVRPLGQGSMGRVYLAHDTLLDRAVAIKFISALQVDAAHRERFFIEARAVARLSHPNVVAVHRVGEVARRPYLVSEYLPGVSLDKLSKPLPWERSLIIAAGLARGLASAHRRGVLHRDIKPANIILGENDDAKLLDFGLAELLDAAAAPAFAGAPRLEALDATTSMPGLAPRPATAGAPPPVVPSIVGTPLYLAPELWRGARASRASDVYALGAVLHEVLTGRAPLAGVPFAELGRRAQDEDPPPVATRCAGLPVRFAELVDACLARDPALRPDSAETLCERLEALLARPAAPPGSDPYRGLGAFQPEHRALFFGRAADARAVVDRLRSESFVVVAGDSGAGKSSLARAAVLPAVEDGALGGTLRWRAVTMTPGPRPNAALDAALATASSDGTLLFVDQLEELLSVADPDEAATAAVRLAELAAGGPRFRLLATARGDFLGRLAGLPGLGPLVGRALQLLGPLGERGLREAIVGPAAALGFSFESQATVEELVASARAARGGLPLLQFTLAELWQARDEKARRIPAGALERLGGVAGALARHADHVMASLGDGDRDVAWRILVRLTTAEGTRAVVSRAALGEAAGDARAAERVVERLMGARLLAAAGDGDRVEVVHEALFTAWPKLVEWRRAHEQGARLRDQLADAARHWHERGRPRGLLWRDDALTEYRSWRRHWPERLTVAETAFGDASEAYARRVRLVGGSLLALLIAGLATGVIVLYRLDGIAEEQRAEAERQRRTLLGEQGWQELSAGHEARALPFLEEALRLGDDTPAIRFLVAEALRPLEREVATILDFAEGVSGVAWSPDGRRIAVSGYDGQARLYDAAGRQVAVAAGGTEARLGPPVFSPDGRRFAAATTDEARVWDDAGRLLHVLPAPGTVSLDLDATRLITAGADGHARLWDLASGALLRTLAADEPIESATFHGDRVAAGLRSGSVLLFDGARRLVLPGRVPHVGATFSHDGARLYTFAGQEARIWDTATGAPLAVLAGHGHVVLALEVSPDDTRLVTASADGTAKVWDALSGRLLADLVGHATSLRAVHFSPDGTRVVTTAGDNTFRVWRASGGKAEIVLEAIATGSAPRASIGAFDARFSPDGELLLTMAATEVKLWRAGRDPLLLEIDAPEAFAAAVFSPDERRILAVGSGGQAGLWDAATGAPLATYVTDAGRQSDASFSRDGGRVVIAADDGHARVYDAGGGPPLVTLDAGAQVYRASFSPDGRFVLTAGKDRAARLWDAATGHEVRAMPHPANVMAATFSPDGSLIATSCWDKVLRIWDAATGALLASLAGASTQLLDVTFSPDGNQLACSGHDGQVFLWDVATRTRRLALEGHSGAVTTVAWSPDGALLATSADDETARIWDAATGKLLAARTGYRGAVMQVVWSRDGRRILTAGDDHTVRVWDVRRDHRPVEELRRLVARRIPWRLVAGRLEFAPAPDP